MRNCKLKDALFGHQIGPETCPIKHNRFMSVFTQQPAMQDDHKKRLISSSDFIQLKCDEEACLH